MQLNRQAVLHASLVVLMAAPCLALTSNDLDRDAEPVVLLGSQVPSLTGLEPDRIIAFRYEDGWIQIPIQVDERAVVDFGTIYNWGPSGYTVLTYTDTAMFTGPDPDPMFDGDDELVFLAGAAGAFAAGALEPEHAIQGSGVELALTNPSTPATAYVYMFESDGVPAPGAGEPDIAYVFSLDSGSYKRTYDTNSGPNPEDSGVTTLSYAVHFSDRWIRDETSVFEGAATGVDIMDRHKNLFAPGNCTRSEDTFSAGEGAFIVNRAGPVRAIRGYVGANSGPTTHRIHAFYEKRETIRTVLRVHAISGMMDYFDYSPAAASMTYANDLNPAGVTIDGSQDFVAPGEVGWEMVTGPQGTVAMASRLATDIPSFTYTSYYSDHIDPPEVQCTGDAHEYGASGLWVDHSIPNTDPALGAYYEFEVTKTLAYGAPGATLAFAEDLADEVDNALEVSTGPYVPTGVAEAEGPARDEMRLRFAPSPANALTVVHLHMPRPGSVSVEIFDVSGRSLGAALACDLTFGPHTIELDVSRLAAGVYLARVEGPGGEHLTRKLAVIR